MPHFHGLIAAPHTPFDGSGQLNLAAIEKQVERLIRHRLVGAFVCGTTGEGLLLTTSERQQVAERWVEVTRGNDLPVIVHVGSANLHEARELARHAQQVGAHAIAALAPCYHRPATLDALVDCCRDIAAAAPELPFYFYHIPSLTQVTFSMADFIPRAMERIPTFAGLKYTHQDLVQLQECLRVGDGRVQILHGFDEILLAGLTFGLTAATGSTYNFAAPVYHGVIDAFRRGDIPAAAAHQRIGAELVGLLVRFGFAGACKAMMEITGLSCGPVRSPLANLTPEQMTSLRHALEEQNLIRWLTVDR